MQFDPNGKYLIQDGDGLPESRVIVWTTAMSMRPDMKPYNPVTGEAESSMKDEPKFPIELQGRNFQVEKELCSIITSMKAFIESSKTEIAGLKKAAESFEAKEIRFQTDAEDLKGLIVENRNLKDELESLKNSTSPDEEKKETKISVRSKK